MKNLSFEQCMELAAYFYSQAISRHYDDNYLHLQLDSMVDEAESIGDDVLDACCRIARKKWYETPAFTSEWFRQTIERVEEQV